ncbi:hypothetical protein SAMN04488544_0865 [Microlunatus sagamiharensis]|uniref:Uncharacterized protein n=1 Tax=Microlunatus sagamiharensis TaxID=546874 RepID=A0A1H2LUQ9_9ACTN|nr:hypothetical protein [Microlunatus sagamiharensis]SDU84614.1 hypothetical protein SAMN04488544_0865 [Microlunatus sagamiharensis]
MTTPYRGEAVIERGVLRAGPVLRGLWRPVRPGVRRGGARLALWALESTRAAARVLPGLRVPGWVPLAGSVAGRTWATPVLPRRGPFGPTMSSPTVLEITIDPTCGVTEPQELAPVAQQVFKGRPRFVVNVGFSCGRSRGMAPGPYTDPRSRWFNLFAGCYQIDVPRSAWTHPFGYRRSGTGFSIWPEDVARLGQADWNYFSNYMYGVPLDAIRRLGAAPVALRHEGRTQVGARWWDRLSGSGIEVSSAFVSTADGQSLEPDRTFLQELWRASFGQPSSSAEPASSFFRTPISTELLVCFDEAYDARRLKTDVYRTFVFGGSVNDWWAAQQPEGGHGENQRFLGYQLDQVRQVLAEDFADLGFDSATPTAAGVGGPSAEPLVGTAPAIARPG